jgi:hypothetical protein
MSTTSPATWAGKSDDLSTELPSVKDLNPVGKILGAIFGVPAAIGVVGVASIAVAPSVTRGIAIASGAVVVSIPRR